MKTLWRFLLWCVMVFVLGAVLAVALAFSQDEECPAPDPETPAWWQREDAAGRIARALMSRHMAPLDSWEEAPLGHFVPADGERHFALVVVPPNRADRRVISVRLKFNYREEHRVWHAYTPAEPYVSEEGVKEYVRRTVWIAKGEFVEKFLLAFTQGHEDAIETLTFGRAVYVLLPTENSDVEKFRKEDIVRE